jgi:hypothetical protein
MSNNPRIAKQMTNLIEEQLREKLNGLTEPETVRDCLKAFATETSKAPSGEAVDYQFKLSGTTYERAQAYVQALRVELSRVRNKLKSAGRVPLYFKMKLRSIEMHGLADDQDAIVTLRRDYAQGNMPDIDDLIKEFAL